MTTCAAGCAEDEVGGHCGIGIGVGVGGSGEYGADGEEGIEEMHGCKEGLMELE